MATLYRDNEYVPQIGGVLRDAVTLSLHDAGEIEAFGVFCGETLADDMGVAESLEQDRGRMRRIHDRMSAFDRWQNGRSREADAREFQRMLERSDREVRSASAQLMLSLAAARETVIADAVKEGRLLALVSIRPQWFAESSQFYEADEPAVIFHEGSWRCSLTWFDEHSAKFILSAGSFAVALVRAAVAPGSINAEALARDVRASAMQRASHRDLAQLERLEAKDVATRKGFILLLHGLFSTDVSTFDGFIDAWLDRREFTDRSAGRAWGARCGIDGADPAAIRESVEPGSHDFDEAFSAAVHEDILVVGWAHNTLTSIKENAAQLLRQIDARLGATEAPIALVCHSRGGLLARKLAVLAPERIRRRLTVCVTFGTPHEGAPFAEREKSLVGLAAMMVLTGATRDGASLMQLLAYLRQERRIAGVEDLARSDVSRGRFLEALRDEERHATGDAPHERKLPVLTVGGRCNPAVLSWTKRALSRMAASQLDGEHDLVVELRSSRPAIGFNDVIKGGLTAECDHTSYFDSDQLTADHFRRVVDILRDRIQLNAAVCARVIAAQPARDERHRRWWAAADAMRARFKPRKPGGETL